MKTTHDKGVDNEVVVYIHNRHSEATNNDEIMMKSYQLLQRGWKWSGGSHVKGSKSEDQGTNTVYFH